MYLKSLTVNNFRKFEDKNNTVYFVARDVGGVNKTEADDSTSEIKGGIFLDSTTNSVAGATTLIVGKNNSGKTTITKAIEKLLDEGSQIAGNDFNFSYLKRLLNGYTQSSVVGEFPALSFKLSIALVADAKDTLMTNLKPFLCIGSIGTELTINIKYEIKESESFKGKMTKILSNAHKHSESVLFKKFLELIDNTDFTVKYYGLDGEQTRGFRLNDLIEVKSISANKNLHPKNLSSIFNKVIKTRYKSSDSSADLEKLIDAIDIINDRMTEEVSKTHNGLINGVLNKIESTNHLEMQLISDLTFDKLMQDLIKSEYSELGLSIPENQFGLGYTNLVNIIGEIIHYVEEYPEGDKQSKINLICIEEPETFMHPQMQESFIKYIDKAVKHLLGISSKNINSQLIITTHSSHILNSKIHSSNSFDNINYIVIQDGKPQIVRLDDRSVSGLSDAKEKFTDTKLKDLKFLKTHIKYKVSELFFSDAVIFVEGVTEETLLNYYIDQDERLNRRYVTVFNINGAHGLVYHPLIKLLKVPTLIITDLDIKREKVEKGEEDNFEPITDLSGKTTTNKTIKKFNNNSDDISSLNDYFTDLNLHCVFQKESVHTYYATSFEEAYILDNFNNNVLNRVLKNLKPRIYNEIVGKGLAIDTSRLKSNSYKLQKKLSNSKSDFANELLYEFVTKKKSDELPRLPQYIEDGLSWLRKELNPVAETVESEKES